MKIEAGDLDSDKFIVYIEGKQSKTVTSVDTVALEYHEYNITGWGFSPEPVCKKASYIGIDPTRYVIDITPADEN